MIVEQIWTANPLRNFNYLIACGDTGDALAIDPLDSTKCLDAAREKGWSITQVLNTHEHGDHTGGNSAIIEATNATLLAHANAKSKIPGIDRGLNAGDVIKIGTSVELEALDTPGHTMSHICLLSHTDVPALFSGDTLFNAGAGNCHGGGHPEHLFETFSQQLARLPSDTRIYPGHDYLENNLQFTLSREPTNEAAKALLGVIEADYDPANPRVTSIGQEQEINTFFRLSNPTIIGRLQEMDSSFPDNPAPKDVFLKLRELRNSW